MRRSKVGPFAMTVLLLGLTSCGGTEPEAPRATTIALSPNSFTLSFLGATVVLTTLILDQNSETFPGVVSWSSDDPAVVTVSAAGEVTAIGNGVTSVRATFQALTDTATVTVQQLATRVSIISGNAQTGAVAQELTDVLVVRSEDTGGAPVAAVDLTFTPAEGSGSVGESTVTSNDQGEASTTWTLGTAAGPQRVTAAIAGAAASTQISATAEAGPATALIKSAGDQQVGAVGKALSEPVVVLLADEFGNGVAGGRLVTFTVTEGGGTVAPAEVTTGSDGTAQTTWTLGPAVGANGLTAVATGLPAVDFTSTGVPPQADLVVGSLTATPSNPTTLQAVEVTATVTNSGDLTTGSGFEVELQIDGAVVASTGLGALAEGAATDVSFTVGPLDAGVHVLRVTADPSDAVTESDEANNSAVQNAMVAAATELVPGVPIANLSGNSGTELLFTMELPAPTTGTMVVELSGGPGDVDLYVHRGERPLNRNDYECLSGGPTTSERCVFNNAEPGTYHVVLFAFTTFSGTTLRVATGGPVVPFDIELVFIDAVTASQRAAFESAAERWASIITTDIADIDFSVQPILADDCAEGQPLVNDIVDDVRIYVKIERIDGPGGTVASAGPCVTRGLSMLPILGSIRFDSEDLPNLEDTGVLVNIVIHEMGHVLGIGTIWPQFRLLVNPSLPSNANADTHFAGPLAIAAFDDAGGTTYTGGAKVPVENTAVEGSADGHWRESVLGEEIMTPFFVSGRREPLSAISVESLADLGYRIDISQADAFSRVFTSPAPAPDPRSVIDLRGDIRQGPIIEVDAKGRIIRVIRR
ncbi:MAG: Ig-like domain-containing protein [Gemmatimonadetes bacterium]|nr:Ig-like domain-containing protein [Gemmatimonadota bacterium]